MDEVERKRRRFSYQVWAGLSAVVLVWGVAWIFTELSRRERYFPALGVTVEGVRPQEVFVGFLVAVVGGVSLWRALVALRRE